MTINLCRHDVLTISFRRKNVSSFQNEFVTTIQTFTDEIFRKSFAIFWMHAWILPSWWSNFLSILLLDASGSVMHSVHENGLTVVVPFPFLDCLTVQRRGLRVWKQQKFFILIQDPLDASSYKKGEIQLSARGAYNLETAQSSRIALLSKKNNFLR